MPVEHPVEGERSFGASHRAGLAVGVALFAALLAYHGVAEIGAALATAGSGLVVVALFHLVPIALDALGWWHLLPARERPWLRTFVFARWIGFSINSLLPVMQIGGNVVRARLLMRHGVVGAVAAASVVVDVTTLIGSQVAFALLGLGLLIARLGGDTPMMPVISGIVVMAFMVAGFYIVQRRGLFGGLTRGLERVVRVGDWLTASAEGIDQAVRTLYRRRTAVVAATTWHFVSWIVGAVEVWLTLWFLGHPVSLATALIVESLGHAIRSAAFAIPGGLGAQEAGYVMLGQFVSLGPDTAIALSLAQRVRDLILGLPGLVVWWLGR